MDTPTVGVQYIELDGTGGKEYTMPASRIATPPVEITMDNGDSLPPDSYIAYLALRDLCSAVSREDTDLHHAVLDAAADSDIDDAVVDLLAEDDGR